MKSVLFTGDFNTVPFGLRRLEAGLRWRRLDESTVAGLVAQARAGAHDDLGWRRDDDVVAAVLGAGAKAVDRSTAEPVRPEGSCYFPDHSPLISQPPHTAALPPRTAQRSRP